MENHKTVGGEDPATDELIVDFIAQIPEVYKMLDSVREEIHRMKSESQSIKSVIDSLQSVMARMPEKDSDLEAMLKALIGEAEQFNRMCGLLKRLLGFEEIGIFDKNNPEHARFIPERWHDKTVVLASIDGENKSRMALLKELIPISDDYLVRSMSEEEIPEIFRDKSFVLVSAFYKGFAVSHPIEKNEFMEQMNDLFLEQ